MVSYLEPKVFKDLGAKRVKMSYGPFIVPPKNDAESYGMKEFAIQNASMPCNDCLLLNWTPDLVYEDGSSANADRQLWLHHAAFLNMGRTDVPCPKFQDRYMASGNERAVVDLTVNGYVNLTPCMPLF